MVYYFFTRQEHSQIHYIIYDERLEFSDKILRESLI